MHPFSPPRFLHKYERQLSILIVGTLRWKIAGSKREAFRQERGFADVSHKSLTFDLKSVPPFKKEHWRKKKKNSIHYSIHSHLTRVAWFPVHQVSLFTNHRVPTLVSFHRTRPENEPLLSYPCLSLEPDTCSSFPPSTRLANGWDQPLFSSIATFRSSNRRNRRIRWVALAPLVLLFEKGEGGKVVFSRLGKETLTRVKKRRDENEKAHV